MAAAPGGEARALINDNPELQSYYQSLESRVGYRLVLGGTRHFGYWYVRMLSLNPPGGNITLRSCDGAVLGRRVRVAAWYECPWDDGWLLSSSDDGHGMTAVYDFPPVVRALSAGTHTFWW